MNEMDMDSMQLQLQAVHEQVYCVKCEVGEGGRLPFKAHPTDAGFDLFATEDIELQPGVLVKHPLNIRLHLPAGTYAEITTKSGLGSKGQLVYAGIIDEAYRGVPHVLMTNLHPSVKMKRVKTTKFSDLGPWETTEEKLVENTEDTIVIKKGAKLAQLIVHPYAPHYYLEQVEKVDTDTDRGEGGFGSSGA